MKNPRPHGKSQLELATALLERWGVSYIFAATSTTLLDGFQFRESDRDKFFRGFRELCNSAVEIDWSVIPGGMFYSYPFRFVHQFKTEPVIRPGRNETVVTVRAATVEALAAIRELTREANHAHEVLRSLGSYAQQVLGTQMNDGKSIRDSIAAVEAEIADLERRQNRLWDASDPSGSGSLHGVSLPAAYPATDKDWAVAKTTYYGHGRNIEWRPEAVIDVKKHFLDSPGWIPYVFWTEGLKQGQIKLPVQPTQQRARETAWDECVRLMRSHQI